jgi:hypothetical protein
MEKFVEQYLNKKGFKSVEMFIYDGEIALLIQKRMYIESEVMIRKELKQYFNLCAHIRVSEVNFQFVKRSIVAERVRAGKITIQEYRSIIQ